MNQILLLRQVLNIELWQTIQDDFAKASNAAIVTVDYKGYPVTRTSNTTEFCAAIQANPILRKRCYRCNSMAGLEAVRLEKPHCYFCQYGLTEVAVPITVDAGYLGAVIIGQRKPVTNDEEPTPEEILTEKLSVKNAVSEQYDLQELYDRVESQKASTLLKTAEMVQNVLEYILYEASIKNNLLTENRWLTNIYNVPQIPVNPFYSIPEPSRKDTVLDVPTLVESKSSEDVNRKIYEVIKYIESHRDENVKMEDMANMCHLSPSYFSKLFAKETGATFKEYFLRQKIEWGKELLENTDLPINDIARKMGFSDESYFGKVFKKIEKMTPNDYRKKNML